MKKLFNFRLVLFVALSVIVGILSAYFFEVDKIFWAMFCLFLFISFNLIYLLIFTERKKRVISLLFSSIFLFSFIFGAINFTIRVDNYKNADLGNHYYEITGKVVEVADTNNGAKYVISDAFVWGNKSGTLKYKIALYVNGGSKYDIGDVLIFSDYLMDKPVFYEGRFSAYDIVEGIKYTVSVNADQVRYIGNDRTAFEKVNVFIRENLKKGLDDKQFGVAYAMLTGNSERMDAEILYSYRTAGVAHIFAVSGLHIGFIATVLNFIMNKCKVKKLYKAIFITLVLFFYSGVCAFSASSLRATIMSSVLLFCAVLGEKYDKYTSVSLSAIIVLCLSPVQMLCVGFQLSFAVVVGIFLLGQPLSRLFKFLPQKLSSSLATVIAAQLVGAPICLAVFGQFSLISIIANLIFIPVVGVVFIALFVALFLGALFNIHVVTFFLPSFVLKSINYLITAFDSETFIISGFSMGGFIVFYYLSVLASSGFVNLRKLAKTVTAITSAIVFIMGTIFYTTYQNNRVYAYVCGSETVCATVVSAPQSNVLIISNIDNYFYTSRLSRIASRAGTKIDAVIFTAGFNADVQKVTSVLRTVFEIERVCYYGERNDIIENAVMKSFADIYIENFYDDKEFSFGEIACSFSLMGNAVSVNARDKNILIFSTFNNGGVDYYSANKEYDLVIVEDAEESIVAIFKNSKCIAYRVNNVCDDAEIAGNQTVLIS